MTMRDVESVVTPSRPSMPKPVNTQSRALHGPKCALISLTSVRPPRPFTMSCKPHAPAWSSLNVAPYVPSAWSVTDAATTVRPSGARMDRSTTSPPVARKFPKRSAACIVIEHSRPQSTPCVASPNNTHRRGSVAPGTICRMRGYPARGSSPTFADRRYDPAAFKTPRVVASARGPPRSSKTVSTPPGPPAALTETRAPGPNTVWFPNWSLGATVMVISSPATAVSTSESGDASAAPYTVVTLAAAAAEPGYATSSKGDPGTGSLSSPPVTVRKYRPDASALATTSERPSFPSTTCTSALPGPSTAQRRESWPCRDGARLPYASRRSTAKRPLVPTSRSSTASPRSTHPATTAGPGSHVPFITSSSPASTSAISYGPDTRIV
mmetsp:Transcript_12061/g.51757  ORF Transcript_12061/g.51757 Transcript_12061/m.51757 type:complete len:382 (-) Transcript_12061:2115-3260(-)